MHLELNTTTITGNLKFYWSNNILEKIGVEIERATEPVDYSGIKVTFGPRILIDPSFGITIKELRSKFEGVTKISQNSSLVLTGENSKINDLVLDGHLVVKDGEVATAEHTSKNYL